MTNPIRRTLLAVAGLVLAVALPLAFVVLRGADPARAGEVPGAAVGRALALARASSGYHIAAHVEQTLAARGGDPTGAAPESVALSVTGDVLPDGRGGADARLAMGSPGNAKSAVDLLLKDGKAFIGNRGTWQAVEDPLAGAAPGGDYLGYLEAVADVRQLADAETAGGRMARYGFRIDGVAYAESMRRRAETLLKEQLPGGVQVRPQPMLAGMAGSGELWVDAAGRPRRQILDLRLPRAGDAYGATAHITVDFSDYDSPRPAVVAPQPGPDGSLVLPAAGTLGAAPAAPRLSFRLPSQLSDLLGKARDGLPLALVLLAATALLLLARRNRRLPVYKVVCVLVIGSQLATPVLQTISLNNMPQRLAEIMAPRKAMAQALGDLGVTTDGGTGEMTADIAAKLAALRQQGQPDLADCRSLYTDQGLQPGDDADGDGLKNGDEWCMGTDYSKADTDGDSITDTLEVAGFTAVYTPTVGAPAPRQWLLDPLSPDSNTDGLDDGLACFYNSKTKGLTCFDRDRDGIPDAWDEDADNDGVTNDADISVGSSGYYRGSVDINVTGHYSTSVVYVDVQVQPQAANHLRYGLTWLDWPTDDKGQIQDLDNSSEDLRFVPVLEITSPVLAPKLAAQYGVVSVKPPKDQRNDGKLWIPLQPVTAGGRMMAFSGRIAFTGTEVGSGSPLKLTGGRILWLTQANLDSYKNGKDASGGVDVQASMVAQFYEDKFRVTGLTVSETTNVQVGLYGTQAPEIAAPTVDDEGKTMLHLISVLAPAFLGNVNPSLKQFNANMAQFQLDPKAYFTSLATYDQRDRALATTGMTVTPQLLTTQFGACTAGAMGKLTPTLVTGYQETSGSVGFDSSLMTVGNNEDENPRSDGITFGAQLGLAATSVLRRVQLTMFTCGKDPDSGAPRWVTVTMNDADKELGRRYKAQEQQPYMLYARMVFGSYYGGRNRIVSLNGKPTTGTGLVADPSQSGSFNPSGKTTLPDYIRTTYQLDNLILNLANRGELEAFRNWIDGMGKNLFFGKIAASFGIPLVRFALSTWRFAKFGKIASEFILEYQGIESTLTRFGYFKLGLKNAWNGAWSGFASNELKGIASSRAAIDAKAAGKEIAEVIDVANDVRDSASYFKEAGFKLSLLTMVVILFITWMSYGGSNSVGIAHATELAQAIASTVLTVLQFILDTVLGVLFSSGVGALIALAILVIVYIIVAAITGDWNPLNTYNYLTEWLSKIILFVDLFVNEPDIAGGPVNMQVVVDPTAAGSGSIAGNKYSISSTLVTTLTVNSNVQHTYKFGNTWFDGRQGTLDDVKKSWAFGQWYQDKDSFNGQNPTWAPDFQVTNSAVTQGKDANAQGFCDKDGVLEARATGGKSSWKNCVNTVTMSFTNKKDQPGRNLSFPFLNQLETNLSYQKCTGLGFYKCEQDMNYSLGPAKDSDPDQYQSARSAVYMDSLPGSLDEIWTWNAKNLDDNSSFAGFNPDGDADGLTAAQEAQHKTDPAKWDSDGDLVADGAEVLLYPNLMSPLKADSDGDGLSDSQELNLNTAANLADTDQDGLADGLEVCTLLAGPPPGNQGGWDVTTVGGQKFHVCSNPNDADADRDGLLDGQEKAAGTSPYAPNTAPALGFTVTPSALHNQVPVTVLKPGDSLSADLSLANTTAAAVDQPLTLNYDSAVLGNLTLIRQVGSRNYIPPTPTVGGGGLSWPMATNPLQPAEAMTATLGTKISAAAQSGRTQLTAQVPYTDPTTKQQKTVTAGQAVLVDADVPSSMVTAPPSGQPIKGQSYDIGGSASDPTSWVSKVEAQITGSGYDSGWQPVSGTEAFSYTWKPLPKDGTYTVRTRATDYVNNVESPGAGSQVIVDNTAPGAGFTGLTDGQVLRVTLNSATLSGTADDTLSGAPLVAGVATVQLSIDGRPWTNVHSVLNAPYPATTTWTYKWAVAGASYGSHSVAVRAVDALGQIGPATTLNVVVDKLPPADMLSNAVTDVRTGQPVALLGHVDDTGNVPLPARPLPLEGGQAAPLAAIDQATVWLMPNGPRDAITRTATWLGDVDGDRRADLAVGMAASTVNNVEDAGRVSLVYGSAGGWPVKPDAAALAAAPTSFGGINGAQQLGAYISAAGDVNGDGLSDLLIGDPLNAQVYLVFGRIGPMGKDLNLKTLAATKSFAKVFTATQGFVGKYFAPAGDVNGDGYDDVLIGVTGLGGANAKGLYYLVLGSNAVSGPLGQMQQYVLDGTGPQRPYLGGAFWMDNAGAAATGVGDLNNDQRDDLALADPAGALGGGPAVYVALGSSSTYAAVKNPTPVDLSKVASPISFIGDAGGKPGTWLAALGDVNGDELADFAYSSGNAPRVAYGRTAGWGKGLVASVSFSGGGFQTAPNGPLAGVGDVNDDGLGDIVLTSSSNRAYLIQGDRNLASQWKIQAAFSDVAMVASAPYAAGADVNCDDSSDLLVVPSQTTISNGGGALASRPGAAPATEVERLQAEARRSMRPELSLGPAPAPRAPESLPSVTTGAAGASPGATVGGQSAPARALDGLRRFLGSLPAARPAQAVGGVLRYVDDDYCASCANDGHAWGSTAFATLQSALDAAKTKDGIVVGPGVYAPAILHGGKDYLTLRGVDADAVFLDAAGGTGLTIFPTSDFGQFSGGIKGVQVSGFTIRNAAVGIQVNYGAPTTGGTLGNPDNIVLSNNVFVQTGNGSNGVQVGSTAQPSTSNVELRHNTFVSNSGGIVLVRGVPSAIDNKIFLYDNLFVALSGGNPLPAWYKDVQNKPLALNTHNGFASVNGSAADWSVAPAGELPAVMKLSDAAFLNLDHQIYRLGAASKAIGKATDATDLGYYNYHGPAWVDPSYCPKCGNDGRSWGVDAFTSLQAAIGSGAQSVLIEPGLYRERIYLVSGVQLFGTGAGHTVIAPPDKNAGTLVSAEGIRDAAVNLLTLSGDGQDRGLALEQGATVSLQRSIVRNTTTAVAVAGTQAAPATGATATLVNNTLASNQNGVAASSCGNVDVRNTVVAFHTGTGISLAGCANVKLHTFNAYWRNGADLQLGGATAPSGGGEIYADPRFTDPNHHDYRPQADSPVVNAGDPSDPTPPGTGGRVDIGYAQSVGAAVYVSPDYAPQGLNDGLEYGVDAFNTIGAAVNHVPDIAGFWTVGVAPGQYTENVVLPSGVRLVGSGADQTSIDAGGAGSTVTIDGATNVALRGFTLQGAGAGPTDADVEVVNASNTVTITHNILQTAGGPAALFAGASTGVLAFNTVANNGGTAVQARDTGTWVQARYNIIGPNNNAGLDNGGSARFFTGYNLFFGNTAGDALGTVKLDGTDITGKDPLFTDPNSGVYTFIDLSSPAIDAVPAGQFQPVPVGGGSQADLGYAETLAGPVTMLFGKEGSTCGAGASGVASVQVGLSKVSDALLPVEQTLPTTWQPATLTTPNQSGSYWNLNVTPNQGDGLYRLYTKSTDVVGNSNTTPQTQYNAAFVADGTPPTVNLVGPTTGAAVTTPAVQLSATASDAVPVGTAVRNNLARVYFLVDGKVVTATLQTAAIPLPGALQPWGAYAVLPDGAHTVQAVAVDRAGNTTNSSTANITVTTAKNSAALVSPPPASAVTTTSVSLVGYARYLDTAGTGRVEVLVDGATQGQATLDNPGAQASRWSKTVNLASDGSRTILLRASRTAGGSGSNDTTVTLVRDTIKPVVSVQTVAGTVVQSVTLSGSASDAGTGLAGVAVSVNGGRSYQAATLTGGNWSFTWATPASTDFAAFPVRVRATDGAGNVQVAKATVTVDNLGPTPFLLSSVDPPVAHHVGVPGTAKVAWGALADGSGVVRIYAATDQTATTTPASTGTPLAGNTYTGNFNAPGAWYIHLLAVDGAGNQTLRHYGPWYAETGGGGSFVLAPPAGEPAATTQQQAWKSSIRLDGTLDLARGEWKAATERMDVDPRPQEPRELWVSFDGSDLYLGRRKATWALGGTGYLYLDTAPGGTRTPWVGRGENPPPAGASLPFDADVVLYVDPIDEGMLKYSAGAWQPVTSGYELREGGLGDVEARVAWSTLGFSPPGSNLRLLTFSVRGGQVTSVFPTNQSVLGPWTSAYTWPTITQSTVPNAGQPQGHHATVSLTEASAATGPLGVGEEARTLVQVTNSDRVALPGVKLILTASAGLQLTDILGYAGPKPAPGASWTLDLGSLAPGAQPPLEVVARAAADLDGIESVTLSARLETGLPGSEPSLAEAALVRATDNDAPSVTIDLPASGAALQSGPRVVSGNATDGAGDGVATVEVRLDNGPWQAAIGTSGWSAPVNVPAGGQFTLQARATDQHGRVGQPASVAVRVDNQAPVATLNVLPPTLNGIETVLSGTARDADGSDITQVEVQIDGVWLPVPDESIERSDDLETWLMHWIFPEEERVAHRLAVRATDAAGNVGAATSPVEVTVDSIRPVSTIEQPLNGATLPGGDLVIWGYADDGWGIQGVDVTLDGGQSWQPAKLGAEAAAIIGVPAPPSQPTPGAITRGPRKIYLPLVHSGRTAKGTVLWAVKVRPAAGNLVIRSRAVDLAGNQEVLRAPVRAP